MVRKIFLIILSGMLLISFTACAVNEEGAEVSVGGVVAIVNNQEIQRADFESIVENIKLSYQQQFGIDFENEEDKELLALIEEEALDNLIQQELFLQSAVKKGYETSKEEIDYEIDQIKAQFNSEEEFLRALETMELTLDLLEEDVANQIMLGQYVHDEIGDPTVSEEEIMVIYEEYSQTMEDIPPFEEIKLELEEEIKYQKFQVSYGELIENLKAESNIEILL